VEEADRPGAHSVADDRRQLGPDAVQLLDQRHRPPQHPAPALNPGGRHQHEPAHALWLLHRELHRDQPAQRMRQHVYPPEPGDVEQAPEPRPQLTSAQPPQPGQLHEMKPAALGKLLYERRPPPP
jgi:hypothetical protein